MATYNMSEELRTLRAKYSQILKEKVAHETEVAIHSASVAKLRKENKKVTNMLHVAMQDVKFQQKRCHELESRLSSVTGTSTTDDKAKDFAEDTITTTTLKRGEGNWNGASDDTLKLREGIQFVPIKEMMMKIHSLEESFEAMLSSKDIELSSSVAELNRMKKANGTLVRQCGDLRKSNELLFIEIQALKENIISTQNMSENCQDLESINERLRIDLRESLKKNFELSNDLRESSNALKSQTELKASIKSLLEGKKDLEESKRSLAFQLEAAVTDTKTMRELNATLASERNYCNELIEELKESNTRISTECKTLQGEVNDTNSMLSTLQLEKSTLQERLATAENSVSRLESTASIDADVRQLRSQLSEAKRQLVEQSINKEAEKVSSASLSIVEKEEHSRKVYENVIMELRTDLEKERKSKTVVLEQIESLKTKCVRVDELEMEMTLYKETAQKAKEEINSFSASISEAYGYREKSSGDRNNAMNELACIKSEIVSLKSENKTLLVDLERERARVKAYNSDKLRIENESADLKMSNSKLEAMVGELKYQVRVLDNNLEKATSSLNDQREITNQYSSKLDELESSRSELKGKLQESHSNIDEMKFGGRDLLFEVKSLQKMREEYKKELQLSRETISSLRSNIADKTREVENLRLDIEALRNEKLNVVENSVTYQTGLNESRLQDLKKEVNNTVALLRKDEQLNVDTLSSLQFALSKEKEKSGNLSNRVNELEQRMTYCVQELDMYKSLDIYRSSIESQLKSYRGDGTLNTAISSPFSRSGLSPQVTSDVKKSAFSFRYDDQVQEYGKLDVGDLSNLASMRPVDISLASDSSLLRGNDNLQNRSTRLPTRRDFEMAKKLLLSSR